MDSTFEASAQVTFIRAGISKKNADFKYLSVSNGRKEFFINLPEDFRMESFDGLKENDPVTVTVTGLLGSDRMTLISIN